jgi:MoaA/NifB/PqqE/SkfB family radical SAM enzyme
MSNFSYYLEMLKKMRSLQAAPKVWNYAKYRCLPRKAVTSSRRYTPQIASLLLTARCNLNCGYCNAAKILREGNGDWRENEATLEKVQLIFANPLFANCLLVDLLGGEPLLINDLERIVAYLAKRGHLTNTSSNGLLLADRITDLKRAGISRINISLYDANRSVMERDLAKINQIFPVHTSFVLLRSMVEQQPDKIIEIARFVRDAGCLSLRFFMYRPMGDNPQPEEILVDTDPAYLEFRRRMDDVLPNFCIWPPTVKKEAMKKLCPQLWQRVTCDMSGKLIICCGIDTKLQGPNSNLFDNKPDVVFNHPTLVHMRKQLMDPKCDPPEVCKTCNLLEEPGW